jgi:photosystem II stability/assembly factor-like uncharacterized protein
MDCFCLWQDAGNLGTEAYSITYDPLEARHLYAATEKGLFSSMDGGESWVRMTAPSTKVVALTFARGSGILFALDAEGAVYRSADHGGTWKPANG